MKLAILRHAPTSWNKAGRIQGRANPGLTSQSIRWLRSLRMPDAFAEARWVTSPLCRAIKTAQILSDRAPVIEPRLTEMDWGAWEGRKLEGLRKKFGDVMTSNEARGLDFRPPGGESPRDVQTRVQSWLNEAAEAQQPTIVVTHKGVIRVMLALATGWNMTTPPPLKLDWERFHLFSVLPTAKIELDCCNVKYKRQMR